jgi:rhodanese-related sulfurtransferase
MKAQVTTAQAASVGGTPTRWKPLAEAGGLLLVAALLAAGAWALRTPRLSLQATAAFYEVKLAAPAIGVDQALQFYAEDSCLFIDIRPDSDQALGCIPGALPVRTDTFADDLYALSDFLYPQDKLVLYGTDDLPAVSEVAARFIDRGYENITIMRGGIAAWRRAGGALSTGRGGSHD